jgi:DNA-binding transcriptional LysR family regulator
MRYDLVDLQLFLHVLDAGSITGGAARAHLALASCSERIQAMEASLGAPLLIRERRGVRSTPAGDVVQRHARLVFQQLGRMDAELSAHAAGSKGRVRLLCNTAALSEYLPEVLAGFMARHPDVDIDLEERLSSDIARAVRDGGADLGIVADTVDLEGLETFPFRSDRLVAVMSPALARTIVPADGAAVSFARLAHLDHIGLAGNSALFGYLARQADVAGHTLRARVRVKSFDAICRMAASGVGIGIVSEPAARRCARTMDIAVVELADAWSLRRLLLAMRSFEALPRHAQSLVETIRA